MTETTEATRKIEARRRGNALGFWFFKASLRCFGLRGAYGLLYLVCIHYVLFDRAAVRAASAYVIRRFPAHGRWRRLLDVYSLFISQGRSLIDRFYVISGAGQIETRVEGLEGMREVMTPGQGVVLLTAHVGNWQTIMTFLGEFRRKVNLVMRPEDNPAVRESLRISAADGGDIGIISPEGFLGGVVEAMNALRRGEAVSFMGDRSYGFSPVVVRFLGDQAWFASGAFHVAAMAGAPVLVLLSARTGLRKYVVSTSVVRPQYRPGTPKAEQLQAWVQDFASTVETFLAAHPDQCFLFYDIWTAPDELKARPN